MGSRDHSYDRILMRALKTSDGVSRPQKPVMGSRDPSGFGALLSMNMAPAPTPELLVFMSTVAYAENFHGEDFHSVAYGGHLYLVCAPNT